MNEYRIQRLKADLTFAQQRNKHQKQQLANYKKVHEKDLKEIERLSKEVDMWNKKYNEQFDIINKLEKWLEDYHNNTGLGEYETGIEDATGDTLKKLHKLKGDSSNETNNNRL